jgi:hypothetical protein
VLPSCLTPPFAARTSTKRKPTHAKAAAEEALRNAKGDLDIAKAQSELTVMAAQIAACASTGTKVSYRDRSARPN